MLGIIAGSGWNQYLNDLTIKNPELVEVCYESVSRYDLQAKQLYRLSLGSDSKPRSLYILLRHGSEHKIAPHLIDYKKNIKTMAMLGVRDLVGLNLVGAIEPNIVPGTLLLPSDLIDYTYGRESSFSSDTETTFSINAYLDFAQPFDSVLRDSILQAAKLADIALLSSGVYGCTQGPRLETAAEIRRLKRDGCSVVGMTAMPEAALAKELGLRYAPLCSVVNFASGVRSNQTNWRTNSATLIEDICEAMSITQPNSMKVISALSSLFVSG